jgi:mannose-1-phosphate guanylyltransferase
MRYAVIMAGGSGVRLWPVSRRAKPKQLIPFVRGKSLLQLAAERLEGLAPPERLYVCAGLGHREAVMQALPALGRDRYLGEPMGRDTLNAAGFTAAVIQKQDPDAVIAVFPADHLIEPADRFREIVARGYALAELAPNTLVTFGIEPTCASTGFGYLQLGESVEQGARIVVRFKEKPEAATAQAYFEAGPRRFLWNSGMFVWRASTLMDTIRRYAPQNYEGLTRIAGHWGGPQAEQVVAEVYPSLAKISVDYAVMEPASRDASLRVAAVPMPLQWLDVGSWATFAKTCPVDAQGNSLAAERHLLADTRNTLVVSTDPEHLMAVSGCEGLIVIHTPDATLVCRSDQAESVKELQQNVARLFGGEYT